MTVLKENFCWSQITFFPHIFDKNPISFTLLDFVNLENEFCLAVLNFYCTQQTFSYTIQNNHFKPMVVLYCGRSWVTNFLVQCAFNDKHFPNYLHSWKRYFYLFLFQNSTCKSYFFIFFMQLNFFSVRLDVILLF